MSYFAGPPPLPNQLYPSHVVQYQRPSLLQTAATLARSDRQDMVCVALHLKRESEAVPWGVVFSKFDDRVVLGKVKDNGRHIVYWVHNVHTRDYLLDWRVVFRPFEPAHLYCQRLKDHVSRMPMLDARHQQLWPGDLLLSIDGFDPRLFQSLTAFTTYLRAVNCCTIVVLRHPRAATAALEHQDPRNSIQPFLAASSADAFWRTLFFPERKLDTPYLAHNSNIVRQVTQDRNLAGTANAAASGPRSLYGPHQMQQVSMPNWNPLDLLSQVALASSTSSVHSFQVEHGAPTAFLKKPSPLKITSASQSKKVIKDFIIPSNWRNPWFKDATTGDYLPFDDNLEFSPEEGQRTELFLQPIHDFSSWLMARKQGWRQSYKVYTFDSEEIVEDSPVSPEEHTVAHDFWKIQDCTSFDNWMTSSLIRWKQSYSWNKTTKQRIQKECDAIVHVSQEPCQFQHWLRIRRNQWRLFRRKRQRQRDEDYHGKRILDSSPCLETGDETAQSGSHEGLEVDDDILVSRKRRKLQAPILTDIAAIDVILEQEDQERKRRESEKRRLVDIKFLFDASLGAPDDVVVLCFSFLGCREYGMLLCINKVYAEALKAREEVWRQLCPSHWILPRRPRKPWHELYFHRLRIEQRDSRKLWDDLLVKCSAVLFKGDHVQKIEKVVQKGEDDFGFDVNYVSPVVCERNSILNLAVIHQRHKVVRWLVDQKRADIESCDRGHFTALLNAAWAGDRQLVRFLLQRGADRTKIGYGHYSKALAHPDFKGLTAEGWARKRGHDDIAALIHLGL